MFSVAYSARESNGTSQSFLWNKDFKARYNQFSKEMPEMWQTDSGGTSAVGTTNCYSQLLLCQGFAPVQTKLTNYGYTVLVSETWSVHYSGCMETAKSNRKKPEYSQVSTVQDRNGTWEVQFLLFLLPTSSQEGLSHYNTLFWTFWPWLLFFFFFLSTK